MWLFTEKWKKTRTNVNLNLSWIFPVNTCPLRHEHSPPRSMRLKALVKKSDWRRGDNHQCVSMGSEKENTLQTTYQTHSICMYVTVCICFIYIHIRVCPHLDGGTCSGKILPKSGMFHPATVPQGMQKGVNSLGIHLGPLKKTSSNLRVCVPKSMENKELSWNHQAVFYWRHIQNIQKTPCNNPFKNLWTSVAVGNEPHGELDKVKGREKDLSVETAEPQDRGFVEANVFIFEKSNWKNVDVGRKTPYVSFIYSKLVAVGDGILILSACHFNEDCSLESFENCSVQKKKWEIIR